MNKIERLRVAHGRVLKARLVVKFPVIKSELMFHYGYVLNTAKSVTYVLSDCH